MPSSSVRAAVPGALLLLVFVLPLPTVASARAVERPPHAASSASSGREIAAAPERAATGARSGSRYAPPVVVANSQAAGPLPAPRIQDASSDTILFRDPDPNVYPHDFAFYYNSVPDTANHEHPWKSVFHLFYIRAVPALQADSIIAHAWCEALGGPWTVDLDAFRPSGKGWDSKKVWAPSIQFINGKYYMFYTGVDDNGDQSIGYATTPVLGTTDIQWTRRSEPVYSARNTSWADTIGHEIPGLVAFRDAFVMPDPDSTGRYLMFNSGEDRQNFPHHTVGVARNVAGTLDSWTDLGSYPATDFPHSGITRVESPLVVRDSLTKSWRMFVANADYDLQGFSSTVFLTQLEDHPLVDTRDTVWPGSDSLYRYVDGNVEVAGWQACEHLQIGPVHFFAAYIGPDGIGITRMQWDDAARRFIFVHPNNLGVGPGASAGAAPDVRFRVSSWAPRADRVQFALDSDAALRVGVAVYDLSGRRVRTLAADRMLQGHAELTWDCRDDRGARVGSGMYFARLTGAAHALVARVPIIH